ncbi:hypothetical protein [Streptomyces sp. NPDC006368]
MANAWVHNLVTAAEAGVVVARTLAAVAAAVPIAVNSRRVRKQ